MRVFGLVLLIVTGAVFFGGPAGFGGAAALAADKPDNDICLAIAMKGMFLIEMDRALSGD